MHWMLAKNWALVEALILGWADLNLASCTSTADMDDRQEVLAVAST